MDTNLEPCSGMLDLEIFGSGVNMLQKIFGYKVELVEHSSEYTLVRGDSAVAVGTQIPVRVSGANGKRTPSVPMVVISCRSCETGGYLISGKFLVDHPDLTGFEIPESVITDASLRAAPRVECHLCVLSRDLPGYRVMTVDLSEGGIQVETPAEVSVGASVLLRIEFDTDRLPPVEASASVAWCSQVERGKYRIGLQFRSIDERSKEIISLYHQLVEKRQRMDVQSRSVRGDSSLLEQMESSVEPSAEVPAIDDFSWKQVSIIENATLFGYLREGQSFKVRLRGGGASLRSQEFVFGGLKRVKDRLESDLVTQSLSGFRYAPSSDGLYRFQFLDGHMDAVLEVEARLCREASTDSN